jgi:nitric oxide reductase subunit B
MTALGTLASANLNGGQKLAVKYFTVALILFGAQVVFGLLAGLQYLIPNFLYGVLDFSINRMVHINAMVLWMLFGFIGSTYWLLEDESGIPVVGLRLGNIIFWIFTLAVVVVVAVFLLVQVGPGEQSTIWFITEGREYIEAPRWADIDIVVCVLTVFYNVGATFAKGK